MPNANWSNPTLTSTYTNFVSEVKSRDEDLALQFDGTTSTNIPTNAIRWDSSAGRWKKWNGSAWAELAATYALTGLTTTGNAGIGTSSPNASYRATLNGDGASVVGGLVLSNNGTPNLYLGTVTAIDAANCEIWNVANGYLRFGANNQERLRITSAGLVGVGESTPVAKLHVRADNAGSGSTPLYIGNNSSSANTAVGISFGPNVSQTADRSAIIYGVNESGGGGNGTGLAFHTNSNGSSPTERARITAAGLVQIGTTLASNFGAKLAVFGGSIHADRNIGAGGAQVQFSMGASSGANFGQVGNTGTRWSLGYGSTPNTIGTEALVWTSSGRVGIGTTSPGYLLEASRNTAGDVVAFTASTDRLRPLVFSSSDNAASGAVWTRKIDSAFGIHAWSINGSERARIDSSGLFTAFNGISGAVTRATAVAVSGSSSVSWGSIPSWVKRISIHFSGVSLSGTDHLLVRLSTGGTFAASSYTSSSNYTTAGGATGGVSSTAGFALLAGDTANLLTGTYTFTNITGNTWVGTGGHIYDNDGSFVGNEAGKVTLSGTLDGIRLLPTGSNTFDAGTVNITYEG